MGLGVWGLGFEVPGLLGGLSRGYSFTYLLSPPDPPSTGFTRSVRARACRGCRGSGTRDTTQN